MLQRLCLLFLRFAVAALLGVALAGCAATRIESFVDPAHRDARYDGFLAYAAFNDLDIEASYERAICRRLRAAGHACDTMLEAAPPTRDQTGASRLNAARHSGAQALIVVTLADADGAAHRLLSDGGPSYRVSLIDNHGQTVIARFAAHSAAGERHTPQLADRLARAIVGALKHDHLLFLRR